MMTTRMFDLNGLGKAMSELAELAGRGQWNVQGDLQKELVHAYPNVIEGLPRIPEMSGFAATTAGPLNKALREAGFDIQLAPWRDDGCSIGAVAILKVCVKWLVEGFRIDGYGQPYRVKDFPAFMLNCHQHDVSFLSVKGDSEPGVVVKTQSGDEVRFLCTRKEPEDWVELYEKVLNLYINSTKSYPGYSGVIVPMIKADCPGDLEWMSGLSYGVYVITQALQQIRFMMNHVGARVESATAIRATRGGDPMYYEIDGPFLCVITRPGVDIPIFAGYLDTDVFADPGKLEL